MAHFFDITQCFSLLHAVRTITLVFFASQLCSQVFKNHVEATNVQNVAIVRRSSSFYLNVFAAYKNLFETLQNREDSKVLNVYFYPFDCSIDTLHFLGMREQNQNISSNVYSRSTISLSSPDEFHLFNDGNTDSSIIGSFLFESTLVVRREFSKLTTFKITIDAKWSDEMRGIVSDYEKHNIHLLLAAIYAKFSREAQQRISLQIKERFPSSVIAQCLDELETFNEQDLFFLYKERLSKVESFEKEGEVMESLLMTLFMERINDVFIKKLPKEFKNLDVLIEPEIPILLDFISLGHFTKLENFHYCGDYFNTACRNQKVILSARNVLNIHRACSCNCLKTGVCARWNVIERKLF